MALEQSTSVETVPPKTSVVALYVRELDQLFDTMDPSPFYEKGLHRDAEEYIVASVKEIPRRPAALVIYLERTPGAPDECQILGDAVRKHFARQAQLLRWELRRLIRRGLISLVIGLVVLAAALSAGEALTRLLGGGHFATVLGESLHIGGWVAMWTPTEIFLYEWWPLMSERRLFEQLSRIPVKIVYTGSPDTRRHSSTCSDDRDDVVAVAVATEAEAGHGHRQSHRPV
jgi:hypothetical protein